MRELLTFDDVLIEPQFSTLKSRSEVNLQVELGYIEDCGQLAELIYSLPVVSSNMDTVTGPEMAKAMIRAGGTACLHRFMSIEENVKAYHETPRSTWCSIGVGEAEFQRAHALFDAGCRVFVIDVAHGAQQQVLEQYKEVKRCFDGTFVIVGNFASRTSVLDFVSRIGSAPDGIKIGVGPGSACTTRIKTGVGIPQLSAIMEISNIFESGYTKQPFIIADGGMRTPGDIAKALAAGANMVMLGGMLAGTNETPPVHEDRTRIYPGKRPPSNDYAIYRGSASKESYEAQGKDSRFRTTEGESFHVPLKGPVAGVLQDIEGGLRSAFTYVGASNLQEFQQKARFVRISNSTQKENGAHGKK